MADLYFDPDVVASHVTRVTDEASCLAGRISGSASADISAAFGVMCQFIAGDFMQMSDAAETGLTKARENVSKTGTDLGDAKTALEGVDDTATTAIGKSDSTIADIGTDALRIALRLS